MLDVIHQLQRDGVAVTTVTHQAATIDAARNQLAQVAAAERADGTAILDDGSSASGQYLSGANQRVVSLLGKGDAFGRLAAAHPVVDLVREALGDDAILLASVTANVANHGGLPMQLHRDQGFVPAEVDIPLLVNAIWPLVDFTEANGATRVVKGSHLRDVDAPSTAIEASVGSVVLLDGRTLHGTGQNTTTVPRPALIVTYCRPWIRPFANHLLDIEPAVFATMDRELRDLVGCRSWYAHGYSELAYERRLTASTASER